MTPLITLTTDFGLADGFAGVLRGVIYSIRPDACVIDLSHDVPPQNVYAGAQVLANAVPYFPRPAVHLCVVDPGVGSSRRPIAIAVGETRFVGPDNGVLSLAVAVVEKESASPARAVHLDNPRYWLPRVSNTFHGRDLFAPCAAHLAGGVPLAELGSTIDDWLGLALPAPLARADGARVGHVTYIDRFGNIVTDLPDDTLASFGTYQLGIQVGSVTVQGLSSAYSDVAKGELVALIGSSWKLEIAVRDGNAAARLGVYIGDPVIVKRIETLG